jgi:integrase
MNYLPALPAPRIKEYPHVTEVEGQLIWAEAKSTRVRCFIKVLWFTGLRISEVLRLCGRDVRRSGLDYNMSIIRGKKAHATVTAAARELGCSRRYIYKVRKARE